MLVYVSTEALPEGKGGESLKFEGNFIESLSFSKEMFEVLFIPATRESCIPPSGVRGLKESRAFPFGG
jgi:hypothetical protein